MPKKGVIPKKIREPKKVSTGAETTPDIDD